MSTHRMRVDESDPRLTTYALGELDGDERASFEAEIAGDHAIAREIGAIREAAGLVQTELRRAPSALGEAQRAAIARALEKRGAATREARRSPWVVEAEGARSGVIPIDRTKQRRATRMRALWVAGPLAAAAAAAALALVAFGRQVWSPPASEVAAKSSSDPVASSTPRAELDRSPVSERVSSRIDPGTRPAKSSGVQLHVDARGRRESEAIAPRERPYDRAFVETGATVPENPFLEASNDPKSTFSVDVDTASYAVVRRSIDDEKWPPAASVRIEEMINYFPYADAPPTDEAFAVSAMVGSAPWSPGHRLVRVGIKGREVAMAARPASNLVFLFDVSGSMMGAGRLDLVKEGVKMLVRQLDARDRVSIVTYAGAAGLVLSPTPGDEHQRILDAIDDLRPHGSTNGEAGIHLAYEQAQRGFVEGGTNRIFLATDGDFNVGVAGKDELVALTRTKAKTGVFLTVLGVGRGNFRDHTLEQIADKGNGAYAYIDSSADAKRVMVEQATGTLITIAKDVKVQIAFDPSQVKSFRLIGYDNRIMGNRDFTDDGKDASEMGAGHTVTAFYEVVPTATTNAGERRIADVALRFKLPDGKTSREVTHPVVDGGAGYESAPPDFRFGAAVAAFGMKLRGSQHLGDYGYEQIAQLAEGALGERPDLHRRLFPTYVYKAATLRPRSSAP